MRAHPAPPPPKADNFSYQCMASNSLSGLHTTCRNSPMQQGTTGSVPAQVSMSCTRGLAHRRLGASSWPATGPSSLQTKRARGGHTQWPHPFPRDLDSHSSWGGPNRDQQPARPLSFCPNAPQPKSGHWRHVRDTLWSGVTHCGPPPRRRPSSASATQAYKHGIT